MANFVKSPRPRPLFCGVNVRRLDAGLARCSLTKLTFPPENGPFCHRIDATPMGMQHPGPFFVIVRPIGCPKPSSAPAPFLSFVYPIGCSQLADGVRSFGV